MLLVAMIHLFTVGSTYSKAVRYSTTKIGLLVDRYQYKVNVTASKAIIEHTREEISDHKTVEYLLDISAESYRVISTYCKCVCISSDEQPSTTNDSYNETPDDNVKHN